MPARHILRLCQRTLLACALASVFAHAALAQFGVRTDGTRQTTLAPEGTRAIALFFVASDCPVSDRTFPEMKRLRESFTARSVRILYVYPNTTETRQTVALHQHAFDPDGQALLDPDGDLVRLTGAKVTPEVSILVPAQGAGWRSVYTGRVDDRFVHLGLERPHPTSFFAETALDAVLAGQHPPRATGMPVGCGIITGGAR